jgi:hypothetical protein
MLATRRIDVVFVTPRAPRGHAPAPEGAITLRYEGGELAVAAPR